MANTVETKFYDEVIKLLDDNKSTNNIIFTRERYNKTIHNLHVKDVMRQFIV
jgi:hypothetical protein